MADDEIRARFLRDRVMTATPAQRVVMLYDRFALDLSLAESAVADAENEDVETFGDCVAHAMQILAELQSSLNITAGGPAENLSSLYTYLLLELVAARGGDRARVAGVREIVKRLGSAFAQVAEETSASHGTVAGSWVS